MRFAARSWSGKLAVSVALGLSLACCGASGQLVGTPSQRTVRGRVVNALNGTGIGRSLVTLNSRSVLTDSQGHFEFPQFADTSATVTAMRPGFNSGPYSGGAAAAHRVPELDAEVIVRLYPDAVVSGMVSGSDGLPLGQVQVLLRRAGTSQGLRWMIAATATTNDRGEFRLRAPAGRFRVSVAYRPRLSGSGETLSPLSFPDTAVNSAQDGFVLGSGEERHIDLRPHTGPAFPVAVTVDEAAQRVTLIANQRGGGIRFTVSQADGESFSPAMQPTGVPGDYRLSLPSGSYLLHAHTDARDESLDGVAKLTVAGHAVSGVVMRMAPATSIGVEVRPVTGLNGTSGTDAALPDVRQLNLRLIRISDVVAESFGVDTSLRQRPDKSYEFRVPAGRYRLESLGQSAWFITAATCGVTDLVTSDLVVGPAGGGQVIRLLAASEHGRVRGRIKQATGEEDLWVYLLPLDPALSLPNPVGVSADGTYVAWMPVGSYAALAVQGHLQQDLRDPEVIARLTAGAATVKVTKDSETSADLELAAVREVNQ